jgi:hypothetical protein
VALDPLASLADVTALGLTLEAGEDALMVTYLAAASASVREAAGVPISETTSTVAMEGPATQWLTLPGPPVTAVASVAIDGQEVTDWRLRDSRLWRAAGWSPACEPSDVTVTQTHGLPTTPADIVMLVARIATATLLAWRAAPDGSGLAAVNIRQESLGDYSVSYGADGGITEMELPQYLREQLAARFGGGIALLRSR